jgi:hypothetical protein
LSLAKKRVETSCEYCDGRQRYVFIFRAKQAKRDEAGTCRTVKKKRWWRKERRVSITIPELELTISEAVKKSSPGCEDFGGVIVRRETPKSHLDPNWAIRGVKFGKADRKGANEALASVVELMQREFLLSDE